MITAISLMLVGLCALAAVALLPVLLKIFLYGLATVCMAAAFVAKHALRSVPWIIAAGGATAFLFFALGLQIFGAGDAKNFLEKFLPPRELPRKRTLSLLTIELMLEFRKIIAAFNAT